MSLTFLLLVGSVLAKPSLSPAAALARSVSVINSWEEEDGAANSSVAQYLDLRTGGETGGFRLDLEGAGRVASMEEEVEAGDDDLQRLYSLALTVTKPGAEGWFTLGRQAISALTGAAIIDGVAISVGRDPFAVTARWGLISDISDDDPEDEETFGIGVDYLLRPGMTLSLDYAQTSDDGGVMEELLAVDWTYSWFRYTKAYVFLNYDLMSETYHEILLGTRMLLSDLITAVVEYSQSVSQFEADSIYSVFAVDAAETTLFSLLFTPNRNTRYTWEYAVESYGSGENGKRYNIGGRWSPGRSTLSVDFKQHTGAGGELLEISLGASTYVHPKLKVGAGADISTTEPEGDESVTSYMGYLGGQWKPSSGTGLSLRVEQSDDDVLEEPTLATRLALSVEF